MYASVCGVPKSELRILIKILGRLIVVQSSFSAKHSVDIPRKVPTTPQLEIGLDSPPTTPCFLAWIPTC